MAESVYLDLTLQQQQLEFSWANVVFASFKVLQKHDKGSVQFFLLLYFQGEILIHINTFHKQKTGKMKLKYSE